MLVFAVGSSGSRASPPTGESGVVAFERGGDIFVANVDGSGERNLTRGRVVNASDPDVSPSGTMIAFDEYLGGVADRTAVINVDGTGLRRLGANGGAQWSPDGSLVAFGGLSERELDVVAPDGSGRRTVATDDDGGFSWSPDGREIAYGSDGGLQALDVMNGTKRTVAQMRANVVAWSPDGSKIAFTTNLGQRLWLVGADGSGLRNLFFAEGSVDAPSWSPDSKEIAFGAVAGLIGPARVIALDIVSGSVVRLTTPEFGEGSEVPSWAPDGSRIAYVRERTRGGVGDVWVMNADGSAKTQVTHALPLGTGTGADSLSGPKWIPGLNRIEPDVESGVTIPARPSRVVKLRATVDQLAADQAHAFFSSGKLGVWSIRSGRLRSQRAGGCDNLDGLAIAGAQTAWICESAGASFDEEWLRTATLSRPRPTDVVHLNYPGLGVAGAGTLIVFSTGRKIWRLDGSRKRLLRIERTVALPLSCDNDRALLERRDGSLEAVSARGRLIGVVRAAQRPAAAALAGNRIVVLAHVGRADQLQVYRLSDGRRVRSWPLAGGSVELQSAHGRLAVYGVGAAIHVIDLVSGHDVILQFAQQAGEPVARLVKAGLVYTYAASDAVRPGRLGFIPRANLARLLRS
jgi:Tol biopolymer transport system component